MKHQESIYPLLLQIALEEPEAKVILPKGGEEIFSLIPNIPLFFVGNLLEALNLINSQEVREPYPKEV